MIYKINKKIIIHHKTIFDKVRFLLKCNTGRKYKTQAEATAVTEYRALMIEKINELEKVIYND